MLLGRPERGAEANAVRRRLGGELQRDRGTVLILFGLAALFLVSAFRADIYHGLDRMFGARPLSAVRTWHYHLTSLDIDSVAKADADLIVTEYSPNIAPHRAWRPDEVARMQVAPDGRRRIVLSYFLIGEAESYRFYWRPEWTGDKVPAWYVAENCAWPRNYMVRFWHDGWKDIIFRSADSFLSRIVAAGFDGVYLDRIDVFWELIKERPTARDDMIRFVTEIVETGRRLKPGFLVVAQNAEDLLVEPRYRDAIDGLGKEDLLYGGSGTNTRNPEAEIQRSLQHIRRLMRDRKPVFAVEYVTELALGEVAGAELQRLGMVPTVAHRSLDGRPSDHERPPSSIKYGTPEWIGEQCRDRRHW